MFNTYKASQNQSDVWRVYIEGIWKTKPQTVNECKYEGVRFQICLHFNKYSKSIQNQIK